MNAEMDTWNQIARERNMCPAWKAVTLCMIVSTAILVLNEGLSLAGPPKVRIQSRIGSGPWQKVFAIYPLKGEAVALRVRHVAGARIRWYQIVPDVSKTYQNANHPWEKNPYKWIGFAKIDYVKKELKAFRGFWEIQIFSKAEQTPPGYPGAKQRCRSEVVKIPWKFYRGDAGSFWFQAVVERKGRIARSYGMEDANSKGLSPKVFRVSIRDGTGYLGYVTSFFNVPGLFGSVPYQSNNYIGADCADVLMAAYGKWNKCTIKKNHYVASLVRSFPKAASFNLRQGSPDRTVTWGTHIRPGDLIAVKYPGASSYQHIGALYKDANKNGRLDRKDLVLHAGPEALHVAKLSTRSFDGHVIVLRPKPGSMPR